MNRQQTLEKAQAAVNARPKAYGPPKQNFDNIAALWNAHLGNRYDGDTTVELDATDVAIMSALIKVARLAETPDHEDSWVDLAGYAACGAEVSEPVVNVNIESDKRDPFSRWLHDPL